MASWDIAITNNGQQPYSDSSELSADAGSAPEYAYCLPEYAILDGTFKNSPETIPEENYGYISSFLSGDDGYFAENECPQITVSYDRNKTSNGVALIFNNISGDYCDEVEITWYKNDTSVVHQQTYYPDSSQYFCNAKVSMFRKLVIVFKKTSRPYRYTWITSLKNQRLSDAGGLKIIYDDIALGAKENSTATSDDKEPYVDMENLKEAIEQPEYSYCYPDYSLLNGEFENSPEQLEDAGYVSASISDENGMFSDPPQIIITLSNGNYSSVGISLTANNHSGDYCTQIKVEWYRDSEKLSEQEYEPDGVSYYCYNVVEYYNKIVITFLKTSRPYRPAFLTAIDYGLQRIYGSDEAYNVNCIMEVNEISSEISSNTLDFSVKTKTEYAFDFQKKQSVRLYFDELLMGQFYLEDGTQKSIWDYDVKTQDAIGILDGSQFYGGVYTDKLSSELLHEILDPEGFSFFLDDAFRNSKITGYIPIGTKRAALQQIAFALGAVVNTAYNQIIQIYPMQTELSFQFDNAKVYRGATVDHSDIVTGVRLYVHSYSPSDEVEELYNDPLDGTAIVEFSEPHHSLTITGGTISESGHNYAVISGTGANVVLNGKKYNHSAVAITKEDERITNRKNIAEAKDATLINSANAQAALERLYDYCRSNETISAKVVVEEQEVGQRGTIPTVFAGEKTGTIRKMDFIFTESLFAEVEMG